MATELDFKPPQWVRAVGASVTLVPCVLIVLYYFKQIKCDRVISLSVWNSALATTIMCIWFCVAVQSIKP